MATDVDADLKRLSVQIENCQRTMTALGDATRQHLILSMMAAAPCEAGLRVNEIAARTNLSRPAVSHHLKILKGAGIVRMRRDGTRNYYTLDADPTALDAIIDMLSHARTLMAQLNIHHHEGAEQ